MHKVSRTLLLAGVLAFGTLTAACGSDSPVTSVGNGIVGIQSVTVTPTSATIPQGTTIQLSGSVLADATTSKTLTWTSSNAAVATVDQTGKVTGVAGGTVTIVATSQADASKSGAAVVTVTPTAPTQTVTPTIGINTVNVGAGQVNAGLPVNLNNVAGQIDVTVNTSGGGLIELFLSTSCTTNTISSTDIAIATQTAASSQAGQVTLSINTAQLTALNRPQFANGQYCLKTRLTPTGVAAGGAGSVVATNNTALTLNNINVFRASTAANLGFTSVTGGPTSAVSTINGLNYNQGTLTVSITPVIFTTTNAPTLISGYLTRNGEQGGTGCGTPGVAAFTNAPVSAAGLASIVFADTGTIAGCATNAVRGINSYTSLPAGDTLYVTSITDGNGNPIAVNGSGALNSIVAVGFAGIRIDNDAPTLAGAYTVTAENGYIGAAYAFSSGTTGTASTDVKGTVTPPGAAVPGVPGVGGVTTTYYVGAPNATTFAAGSCSITGLTAATTGADLANTSTITPDQAKVVVKDALGNQICQVVGVTAVVGSAVTFGVDKIAPTIIFVPPVPSTFPTGFSTNSGAAANTGYNTTQNFSLVYNDSISGFTNSGVVTPLVGTLTRNTFAANTSTAGLGAGNGNAAGCVVGTYTSSTGACANVAIAPMTSVTTGQNFAPYNVNSIEFTFGTATPGYYLFTVSANDLAKNNSGTVSRLAAFDNVAPAITVTSQSPAAVAGAGTVTVNGTATDNLDLTSSTGRLSYATAPAPFQSVAGTSFGPNFDATTVTSATASVAIPNVYRGLQSVDGTNTIQANRATATATITVTDVGTNSTTSAPFAISSAAGANILTGNTFTGQANSGTAPATRQASTNITFNVGGLVSDPAFQSQPFAQVDLYKLVGGELVLQSSTAAPSVTDVGTARTYSYSFAQALAGPATNTFYAVGRNAGGDAIISNALTITNP